MVVSDQLYKKTFSHFYEKVYLTDNIYNYSFDSSDAKDESNPPASK
jgi:hypothetical protein